MKKLMVAMVALLCVITGFLGAAGQGEKAPTQAVTLKTILPGDRPKDMDVVLAEVEKRLAADGLAIKLNVVFVPWGDDLKQKPTLMLTSGEAVDLAFDAPWNVMVQNISQGFYTPLEDLLKQSGPDLLKTIPKDMLDANMFPYQGRNRVMGIPLGNAISNGRTYYIRKDVREKLGVAPIKTFDDLVAFAYKVKENMPDMVPWLPGGSDGGRDQAWASFKVIFTYNSERMATTVALPQDYVLYFKQMENNGRVHNFFDEMNPIMMDAVNQARKLYQDRIIYQDVLAAIPDASTEFTKGRYAIGHANDFGVNPDHQSRLQQNVPTGVIEAVSFFSTTPKDNMSAYKQWNFMCIPQVSKNKELAMKFLNWTRKAQANYDLVAYGIQGVHWNPVGADQYEVTTKGASDWRWFPYAWVWNPMQDRQSSSFDQTSANLRRFCQKAENFTTDILAGFNFDATPVQNEIAQFNAIESKYTVAILDGVVDPTVYLAKFKDEAGGFVKKIQIELQKQIDAFLAANTQ